MKIKKFIEEYPGFQIVAAGNSIFNMASVVLKKFDVNLNEGLVLVAFFFEKGRFARPSQISEAFGFTKSNVSHIIRSLEKKKFLKRSMHESDARGYVLELTAKGEQLCPKLIAFFDKTQNKIEQSVDKKNLDLLKNTLELVQAAHAGQNK